MAIRNDSYGSTAEVLAFSRYLLAGQSNFNSTTRPTITEVEKFIDRASGALNVALAKAGLGVPVTNTTAKLLLDEWVVTKTVEHVELTQRGTGFSDGEGSRYIGFRNLHKAADEFVTTNAMGLKRIGVTIDVQLNQGLAYTGLDAQADRADPDDSSLEQPKFKRGLFDNEDDS